MINLTSLNKHRVDGILDYKLAYMHQVQSKILTFSVIIKTT